MPCIIFVLSSKHRLHGETEVVNELRRQLDETRREVAELRLQVALGGAPATGQLFADVVTGRRDDVAVFPASAWVYRDFVAHLNVPESREFRDNNRNNRWPSTRRLRNTGR
ncbi:hypothetical protein MRX96_005045 [Rhipicephalus microplus]